MSDGSSRLLTACCQESDNRAHHESDSRHARRLVAAAAPIASPHDYPIRAVPMTAVTIDDGFWAPKLEVNRTVTIPHILKENDDTGRVANFEKAAGKKSGAYEGRRFNDTDIYKIIEAASYSLAIVPDPRLSTRLDELIQLIAESQEKDGYLFPARTIDPQHPGAGRRSRALDLRERQPRALQRRPSLRGGRRAFRGDRQAHAARRRDQERRSRVPDVRSERPSRGVGPRGNRARAREAVSRHRQRDVPQDGRLAGRRARQAAPGHAAVSRQGVRDVQRPRLQAGSGAGRRAGPRGRPRRARDVPVRRR